MEGKEKYYTPIIEEFHVGFEYEVLEKAQTDSHYSWSTTFPLLSEDTWYKFTYPDPFLGYRVDKLLEKRGVRVKYLDREDIESLGFVCEVVDCGEDTQYDVLGIRRVGDDVYLGNFYLHFKENINLFGSYYVIKNKSELKRLLKQLNIL